MALNQEQLEKQGFYEAKAPLASLLADLDQIGRFAQIAAARKRRHAKSGGFLMLGGLIGSILGAIVFPPLVGLGGVAIIAGLVWWIYSFFAGGKLVEHPMRLGVANERLKMLQEDASAKNPFSLRLALATKPTLLRNEPWNQRNGKQEFYEESWFSLEGQLLDGTYLSDEVKDLTRKRHYKSSSGKHKSKTRSTYLVDVRFSYPPAIYGVARGAEKALHGQVKVPHSASLRAVRVSEKAIVMKALVLLDKEIAQTMGMLSVGGYRILNLARKAVAAGQRGTGK
jgi:hypothetical protein